jgi:putative Mn2+ efflux pump MntP
MSWIEVLLVAVALGMDAFAVAVSAGICPRRSCRGPALRMATAFGVFQTGMTLLGYGAGAAAEALVRSWDHWLAFGLLLVVGLKNGWEALGDPEAPSPDASKGWALIMLAVATSIDAFAVGFSFSTVGMTVWLPSLVIGVVAFAMTYGGFYLGRGAGRRFGKRMGLLAGAILISIGVKILMEHLG